MRMPPEMTGLETHRFFVRDRDGKFRLIAGFRELCHFKAELNDAATTLEVINIRLSHDSEVDNTGVWRVQGFLALPTDTHTHLRAKHTYELTV